MQQVFPPGRQLQRPRGYVLKKTLVAVVYEVQKFVKAREHIQEGISAILCKTPTWFLGKDSFHGAHPSKVATSHEGRQSQHCSADPVWNCF